MLAVTELPPNTHIVGKQGKQQCILAIVFEVFKAFPKVGTEQKVRLPFRHICRKVLVWLQLMSISNVWIILPAVQTLTVFFAVAQQLVTTTTAHSKGGKSANRTLRWARLG